MTTTMVPRASTARRGVDRRSHASSLSLARRRRRVASGAARARAAAACGRSPRRRARARAATRDDRLDAVEGEDGDGDDVDARPSSIPRNEGVRDGAWAARMPLAVVEAVAAPATASRASRVVDGESFALLGLTSEELKRFAVDRGMRGFRGKQMADHLHGGRRERETPTILPPSQRRIDARWSTPTFASDVRGCITSPKRTTVPRNFSFASTTTAWWRRWGYHARRARQAPTHRVRVVAGGMSHAVHVLRHR